MNVRDDGNASITDEHLVDGWNGQSSNVANRLEALNLETVKAPTKNDKIGKKINKTAKNTSLKFEF